MSTILIVDDTALFREPIAAVLRSKGYQTLCAENGQEALQKMGEQTPDLVLLDVAMPIMDGLTFLRLVREQPQWKHVPVILLTAMTEQACLEAAPDLEMPERLVKSRFSLTDLLSCVSRHLDKSVAVGRG